MVVGNVPSRNPDLNVLDQIYKSGNPTPPALASATKHWDSIYVSRYYSTALLPHYHADRNAKRSFRKQ